MNTTTLLVVIGCGVLVKTLAFMGFVMRRDRRQRRALAAARAAAVAAAAAGPAMPGGGQLAVTTSSWRLQWAEPGVLLVENATGAESARDVELSATLTTGCGRIASLVHHERFVGTGACFTAPFVELQEWLADAVLLDPFELRQHLVCSLDAALTWRTDEGERCAEAWLAEPVVPVPDLALEIV